MGSARLRAEFDRGHPGAGQSLSFVEGGPTRNELQVSQVAGVSGVAGGLKQGLLLDDAWACTLIESEGPMATFLIPSRIAPDAIDDPKNFTKSCPRLSRKRSS
ncbi:MAG: hypothetical protein JO015_13120 [Verrucomicrobia bacterium]|nr:hypothetical protein [Verrucomicrobiota bacterium]